MEIILTIIAFVVVIVVLIIRNQRGQKLKSEILKIHRKKVKGLDRENIKLINELIINNEMLMTEIKYSIIKSKESSRCKDEFLSLMLMTSELMNLSTFEVSIVEKQKFQDKFEAFVITSIIMQEVRGNK